jgi:hypothetical protein
MAKRKRPVDFYTLRQTQSVMKTLPKHTRDLVPINARIRCTGFNSQFYSIHLSLKEDKVFPPRYEICIQRIVHRHGLSYIVSLLDRDIQVGGNYVMSQRRYNVFLDAIGNLE